jgi:hypothetical protein
MQNIIKSNPSKCWVTSEIAAAKETDKPMIGLAYLTP